MSRFVYTATKDGKKVTGSVEATTKEAAIKTLAHQDIHTLIIKEESAKKNIFDILKGGKKVKSRDLVVFTRQLSTMVSAGVPLTRALTTLQSQTESKYFN